MMKIAELLTLADRSDTEALLAFVLKKDRSYLYAYPEVEVLEDQLQCFLSLVARRKQGEPLAYLTGQKEFWSLDFTITPDVLVPRPETECLVEWVLEQFAVDASVDVADLGTGSGAIACALAHSRQHWHVVATDLFTEALMVAKENARRLHLDNIQFLVGYWCQPLAAKFDVIVSNPPYIAKGDPELAASVEKFEPKHALIAGEGGLKELTMIASQARQYLKEGAWLVLEHGFEQAELVQSMLAHFSYHEIKSYQDYSGLDRFVVARF